jgi:hypothetical protein
MRFRKDRAQMSTGGHRRQGDGQALTEMRASKHLFDVMINNSSATTVMLGRCLRKYNSPAAAAPQDVIDANLGCPIARPSASFTTRA